MILLVVNDVRVMSLQGGGTSPLTTGEIHLPERDNTYHYTTILI